MTLYARFAAEMLEREGRDDDEGHTMHISYP